MEYCRVEYYVCTYVQYNLSPYPLPPHPSSSFFFSSLLWWPFTFSFRLLLLLLLQPLVPPPFQSWYCTYALYHVSLSRSSPTHPLRLVTVCTVQYSTYPIEQKKKNRQYPSSQRNSFRLRLGEGGKRFSAMPGSSCVVLSHSCHKRRVWQGKGILRGGCEEVAVLYCTLRI